MAAHRGLKKIRFLHISDLHMGRRWYYKYGIESLLKSTLEKLVEFVRKEDIDILLIGGDLYENTGIRRDEIAFIMEVFRSIKIPIYIAPGNHDYYVESYYLPSKLDLSGLGKLPDNVKIFSEEKITRFETPAYDIYGRANYGMNERPFDIEVSPDPSKINIYLFHGSRQDFIPPQKEMWLPFYDKELIESRFDYIALGHYHSYQEITGSEKIRGLYPGSFIPTQIDELDERYGVVVEIEKDGAQLNMNLDKKVFSDFLIRSIELFSFDSEAESLVRRINEKIDGFDDKKRTLFRIDVKGQGMLVKDEVDERLRERLYGKCVGYELDMDGYIHMNLFETPSDNTVKGRFISFMREKIESEKDPKQRLIYENALIYGIKAFNKEEIRPMDW